MAKVAKVVTAIMSEEAPALTGFLQVSAKTNRKESNQEIIIYWFFTVMRRFFALQE